LSRAVAFALVLVTATTATGCASYEGSRDTAALSGVAFVASLGTLYAGDAMDDEPVALTGLALGTASMLTVLGSAVGMAILPKRVELALRLAHELVAYAEAGRCSTVVTRRAEVQELDNLVYEVVLMEDPAVSQCVGLYFPLPSSSSASPPADPERPDPASTSIAR
jgi:hypothetical protein